MVGLPSILLTDGLRKERRLDVLNRILRQIPPNKVTVIEGGIDQLLVDVGADSEFTELAKTVCEASGELLRLADEATEIQRTLNESLPSSVGHDCTELIQTEADQMRHEHRTRLFKLISPLNLTLLHPITFNLRLRRRWKNAIEHNSADHPHVYIQAKPVLNGEWVDITVGDNGPQIPAKVRDIVTGERDISPTAHGSGLGFWLVKWTVDHYGGESSFDVTDDGNRVRMRLPRPREKSGLAIHWEETGTFVIRDSERYRSIHAAKSEGLCRLCFNAARRRKIADPRDDRRRQMGSVHSSMESIAHRRQPNRPRRMALPNIASA